VLAIADNGDKTPVPELLASDPVLQALVAPLIAAADLTGKFVEPVWDLSPAGVTAQRILFLGAGKRDKFSLAEFRKFAGAAARAAKSKNIKSFVLVLPELLEVSPAAQAAVEGIVAGDFDVDTYRSDRKDQQLTDVTLAIPADADTGAVFPAIAEGAILAESQNFTRTLALEPSNLMTPAILAEHARAMCEEVGLACEVYGSDKLKELKMGAFLSVSQGSEEEPRLVVMRYEPASAPATPVLGLVGKGITFDSGGISIKPADGMEKMKYDMCGAATMIGAMRAIALLKPDVRVISVLCCSENMPDGKAQKPGDVQFAMNGKSIEVINTDAEGRLVLADGLCYARSYPPRRCRHPDRRGRRRPRLSQRRRLRQQRLPRRGVHGLRPAHRRKDVAYARRCRLLRAHPLGDRRYQKHRRTLGRGHHGRHVSQGIRR
jgi:leucyl aminopeptidase